VKEFVTTVLLLVWVTLSQSAELPKWQAEWQRVIEAAKKEGQLSLYGGRRSNAHLLLLLYALVGMPNGAPIRRLTLGCPWGNILPVNDYGSKFDRSGETPSHD
jgi:hypothetical protein